MEAQVLGLGAVHQYLYTLQLKNRPPEAQPVAVTVHGIAVANPPRQELYQLLPRHPDNLGNTISLVCLNVVKDRQELEARLASAKTLHVRTRVLVAWVNYLAEVCTAGAVDDAALAAWQATHPTDAVPASLVAGIVAPADSSAEALVRGAFMHDRAGNSNVREANLGADVAAATSSGEPAMQSAVPMGSAASERGLGHAAAFFDIASSTGIGGPVSASAATSSDTCLDELEVILPVGLPPPGPHEAMVPEAVSVIEQQLTQEKRLVYCAGGPGAKLRHDEDDVLSACFPTAFPHTSGGRRPMGMSNKQFFRHVSARVPRAQFSGNLPMLARMMDVLHLEETRHNTFVMAKTCGRDVSTVGYIPRDIVRAVATVLALPRQHPARQAALKSSSPLVRALVTTMRRTAGRIDMTDAYYTNAQSSLRFVSAATGPPLLAFNINPADMHSGAAIVAAGEVVQFGDDGVPTQVDTVTRRWRRVKENPHACKSLLKAVIAAILEVLFGWKEGAREQHNSGCFCGVVFHVTIKVEQSGRLALHIHGLAHLATFTVERMRELFEGPNCRALALAQALCAMWYPEPYYDPKGADVLVYGTYRAPAAAAGMVPVQVAVASATVAAASTTPAMLGAVITTAATATNPAATSTAVIMGITVQPIGSTPATMALASLAPSSAAASGAVVIASVGSASIATTAAIGMPEDADGPPERPPPEKPPPPVDRLPPASNDFAIIAGSRIARTAAAVGLGVKRIIRKRCAGHLATVTATSNTHGHSDTCKRHGCAGVDGDCGMEYPRFVRRHFLWIGDGGLFALPRYGRNIVSHMPAVSMAFGCNNNFTLACEVDRQLTTEVAAELERPVAERNADVVAPVTMPAQLRAHLSSYYTCKYVCKAVTSSQATNLVKALAATRDFLAEPGAAVGSYAATVDNPAARGFGNVMAAVNRLTTSVTVGMAMASYRLGGDETILTTYSTSILTHGPFAALAAAAAPGDSTGAWGGEEGGADTIIVIPDDEDDPDAPAAAVTCVTHYRLRGPELDGPECSPFMLAMTYEVKRLRAGHHPAMQPVVKRSRPSVDVTPSTAAAAQPGSAAREHVARGSSAEDAGAGQHTCCGTTAAGRTIVFMEGHPWIETHAHHRFKQTRFVRLLGPIPKRPPADDSDGPAAQEYYAFVLGVFKAYRAHPVPPGMSLRAAYEDWRDRVLPSAGADYAAFIHSYLDALETDHACRAHLTEEYNRRRREARAQGRAQPHSDHDTDEEAPLRQRRVRDVGGGGDNNGEEDCGAANLAHDADDECGAGDAAGAGALSAFDLHLRNLNLMFDAGPEGRYALGAAASCTAPHLSSAGEAAAWTTGYVRAATPEITAALRRACNDLKNYRACNFAEEVSAIAGAIEGSSNANRLRPRRLCLVRERGAVFAAVTYEDASGGSVETRLCQPGCRPPMIKLAAVPTIADTVNLFTLAADQAVPFMLLAGYFDRRHGPIRGEPPQIKVVGGPGTGKSQFVHALLWYTFQHDDPNWLATASYAWTAALAFTTPFHRSVSTCNLFGIGRCNALVKERSQQVRSVIANGAIAIDEIGYNSLEHLGVCNLSAQRALDPPGHLAADSSKLSAFKGRPFALVGDIFQNVQPRATPVYKWAVNVEAKPNFSPRALAAAVAKAAEQKAAKAAASTSPATPAGNASTKDKAKGKGEDSSGLNENAMQGFEVYRAATDVFMLEKQQRQDSSQGGRDLTAYSQFFNGQRVATMELIGALVDDLNCRACNLDKLVADATPSPAAAAADPNAWARRFPRVVLQRNAPRHVINTCLMQRAAQLAKKRLVVWNASHTRVRPEGRGPTIPLTALEQLAALREEENSFDKLTADTWYFEGAPFICTHAQGVDAGSCVNNLVRAVGLITDPREPPDSGRGAFWRLKYLPRAVLVVPVNTETPHDILGDAFAELSTEGAFPVTPVASRAAVQVEALGLGKVKVRHHNLPLGDAFAVTDFFVQGASFGDKCWVVDLVPTPLPKSHEVRTSRACLFVVLTRYRSMDDVHLLRPLYRTPLERIRVIKSFLRAASLPPDLAAEDRLLRRQAKTTRQKYNQLFQEAVALEAARAGVQPSQAAFNLEPQQAPAALGHKTGAGNLGGCVTAAEPSRTQLGATAAPLGGVGNVGVSATNADVRTAVLSLCDAGGRTSAAIAAKVPPVAHGGAGRKAQHTAAPQGGLQHAAATLPVTIAGDSEDTACYVCGRRDGSPFMLLCDGVGSDGCPCIRGAHIFCVRMLPCVPDGPWHCNVCCGHQRLAAHDAPVIESSNSSNDADFIETLDEVKQARANKVLVVYHPNPALDLRLAASKMRSLLSPGADVHGDVMEVAMRMLQVCNNDLCSRGVEGVLRCYFMGTYFLAKFAPGVPHALEVNYDNVKRWTAPARLRNYQLANAEDGLWALGKIVIPMHWPDVTGAESEAAVAAAATARSTAGPANGHWMCAVVDLPAKCVTVYDSLGPSDANTKAGNIVLKWVKLEAAAARRPFNETEWCLFQPEDVPRQQERDCGIYTILFAYCAARGLDVPPRSAAISPEVLRENFTYMLMNGAVGLPPL